LIVAGHVVKNIGVGLEIGEKAITVEENNTTSEISFLNALKSLWDVPHEIEQINVCKQFSISQRDVSLCTRIRILDSPVLE
jgi:hypothetical protein